METNNLIASSIATAASGVYCLTGVLPDFFNKYRKDPRNQRQCRDEDLFVADVMDGISTTTLAAVSIYTLGLELKSTECLGLVWAGVLMRWNRGCTLWSF